MNISVVFHGDERILPQAEQAVKNFVDTIRSHSQGKLEIYANFVKVGFGPPVEVFEKSNYGYFAREKDLGKVVNDQQPCGVIRIYHHAESENAFRKAGKLPADWTPVGNLSAKALTWGVHPPYSAIPWDKWLSSQGNEPIENVLIHEFLHQIGSMFERVGIKGFDEGHNADKDANGIINYAREFRYMADKVTPVPWDKLAPLTGIQPMASKA